jgi:aspartate kinase
MGRSVEYARRYQVPLHVRSSFSGRLGTIVSDDLDRRIPVDPEVTVPAAVIPSLDAADPSKEIPMENHDPGLEAPIIAGVAHDRSQGKAALLFDVLASADANVDMIVQNSSTTDDTVAISLTLPEADAEKALAAIDNAKSTIGFTEVRYTDQVGKVSIVGAGMKSSPGVSATLFRSLADAGINIDMISTSEIRISVVTDIGRVDDAVRVIHTAFDLDADQEEAVVYGGTGR